MKKKINLVKISGREQIGWGGKVREDVGRSGWAEPVEGLEPLSGIVFRTHGMNG